MERALFALAHVASQLLYKWLPPPEMPAVGLEAPFDTGQTSDEHIASMDVNDWRMLLHAPSSTVRMPWLLPYLARHDSGGFLLARAALQHFNSLVRGGARYLCLGDQAYPALLRALPDPPLGLTVLGHLEHVALPAIAVVGSRKASAVALRVSAELGRALAGRGLLVVSGGALGCDIAAHHGVLAGGLVPAPAACVFAGGLHELYPRANAAIFRRLRDRQALLISERLWWAPCRPLDFPARNRIISGWSQMTVVIQAAQRSGALLTARLALDQGRDVVVLRHPAGDVRAAGSLGLLNEGAWGFSEPNDLIERLNVTMREVQESPLVVCAASGGHERELLLSRKEF